MQWAFTLTAADFAAMSDDELMEVVVGPFAHDRLAVDELRRRERERCARECELFRAREEAAFRMVERATFGRAVTRGAIEAASQLAERIRELT